MLYVCNAERLCIRTTIIVSFHKTTIVHAYTPGANYPTCDYYLIYFYLAQGNRYRSRGKRKRRGILFN